MSEEVWLLLGNRAGEIAQQRALGVALGRPLRELVVARMAPTGKAVVHDFSALAPPWPALAISFGKTLAAALEMRARGATQTRFVQLGLPRKLPVQALDLIVPMPTDQYVPAPNVLRVRMPLNPVPAAPAPDSPVLARLQRAAWPRPWIALFVGGPTTRAELSAQDAADVVKAAVARAQALGGSLLVSTSPRTPADALPPMHAAFRAYAAAGGQGEFHVFTPDDAAANPYAAYLRLADELIVTGDSASMIAECWRSGRPLRVAPLRTSARRRVARALRRAVPPALIASGRVSGDVDVERWVARLAREGWIGLLGRSDPRRPYRAQHDDDVARIASRIGALLSKP